MKKFTKYTILIALAVLMLFTASCVEKFSVGSDFLEKGNGSTTYTADSVFSKAETARYFLWNAYSYMYFGLPTKWGTGPGGCNEPAKVKMNTGIFELLSDCFQSTLGWSTVEKYYYSGSYNSSSEPENARQGNLAARFPFSASEVWECVRSCWNFIERVDGVPDMTEEEKARLKAEAKIIIASRYFDLFRHYGGLPLVDHVIKVGEMQMPERATVESTVNFMVDLLDEAISEPALPWNLAAADIPNWDGRMTKGGAMGLKCKILLFAASPLFNDDEPYCTESPQEAVQKRQVWYGSYRHELWEETVRACEDFWEANARNGNYYTLSMPESATSEGYREAYYKAYMERGNREMLISTRENYSAEWVWQWDYVWAGSVAQGVCVPTQEFVDMFPNADGTPFDSSEIYGDNPKNIDMYKDRDPRLYENVATNMSPVLTRKLELWEGGKDAVDGKKYTGGCDKTNYLGSTKGQPGAYGYGIYKYMTDFNKSFNQPIQWPYLRMAELYLIYAEALAETGDLLGALDKVNEVRARVGLGKIEECNKPLNLTSDKENLIKEIMRERACELGLEDTRFFDMVRRKMADDFTKELHGVKIYRKDGRTLSWYDHERNEGLPEPDAWKYELQKLPARAWQTNFSPKWYLSAFPPVEINKEYGLTQNPGW